MSSCVGTGVGVGVGVGTAVAVGVGVDAEVSVSESPPHAKNKMLKDNVRAMAENERRVNNVKS